MRSAHSTIGLLAIVFLTACGSDTVSPPPPPPSSSTPDCGNASVTQLAAGEHQVIDPSQTNGCVRVPQAGSGGGEYVVVFAATNATQTNSGVSGPYAIRAANPGATAAPEAGPSFAPPVRITRARPNAQEEFDAFLRQREASFARDPANRSIAGAPRAALVPQVGDVKTFKSCGNINCSSFVDVTATARYVGTHAAIYMDNSVPQSDTLRAVDYQDLGQTFDAFHYPIDTTAFGTESDVDGNQRVIILMTDAVNALTPDCSNGRVLGYFSGTDLILTGSGSTNSNKGEIFYTLVPSPAAGTCRNISHTDAVNLVKPTLIHEFQHMISYNQHVLVRGGQSELNWLNEALSHFAEELGGRQIPVDECTAAGFNSCRSQYISGDITNAYDFATKTESEFTIYPGSSTGTLEERGASWLLVRWVADQYATDTILGTNVTRGLLQTSVTGAANLVTAANNQSFATMIPEWLLSIYLDDLDSFTPLSDHLRFKSWGLRSIWTDPRNQAPDGPFNGFPLVPAQTSGSYTRSGTLRGGSGGYLRLVQQGNGPGIDVQLLKNLQGDAIDPALSARIGIARIR